MLIIATSPHQTIVGLSESMWHANTPHSDERFERDRHPVYLTLGEFERHLQCLPLTIGDTTFRRAMAAEVEAWREELGL